MAIALVVSTKKAGDTNAVTTDAVDTSGANLIVISAGTFGSDAATPTDSKGNTYTPLTSKTASSEFNRLWYCASPIVGSGHTFTISLPVGYPAVAVMAFSGAKATSPADQENGATATSAVSVQTGSITPSENGCVVVAGLATDPGTGAAMSGYTVVAQDYQSSVNVGACISYLVQTTAAAANPTWTWTGSGTGIATIASFKAAPAAAASGNPAVGGRGRLRHWGLVP